MTHKTVDMVCSMEGVFPIILEAIDSEDVQFALDRREHYAKCYEDVHIFAGIEVVKNYKFDKE
ncbi:hypothetical protein [Clostridium botulinum]|uniref:hypothetical protein n=1 Tax=Clostridium botulinum TaxID=1491 RepID=UPI00057F1946|nr:hypothetical protein [Clostridium botulinum]QPW62095.1 hypothetical protein IG390_13635 [Clostridium botulinum]